jgi:hypothetical protein
MAKHKQDPESLERRRATSIKLLQEGYSNDRVQAALKKQFGLGIGTIWLNTERHKVRGTGRQPPKLKSNGVHGVLGVQGVIPEVVATPDPRIVAALLTTKVPFTFDGQCIKLLPAEAD